MPQRKPLLDMASLKNLRGPRLSLRRPRPDDAEAVYAYASDGEVTRFLAWPMHICPADSQAFLQLAEEGWRKGDYLVWLIEDGSGVVGAIGVELSKANAGIGYVLARKRWGRGYATEALRLVSDTLFRASSIDAIWAVCVTENPASRRVLEKSGFHFVRTQTDYFACPNLGGEKRDVWLFGKDRDDKAENR